MNVESLREQLADEIAEVAAKAMKDQGFEPSESLKEKIRDEIYWSIRLGR